MMLKSHILESNVYTRYLKRGLATNLVVVSILLTAPTAFAAWTSAKSYNCIALLEQVNIGNYLGRTDLESRGVYTLNSIESFGQHVIGTVESDGGTPNVHAHSDMKPTVALAQQISDRLKGIQLQTGSMGETQDGDRQVSYAFTLTDPKDIRIFVDAVFRRSENYRATKTRFGVLTKGIRMVFASNVVASFIIGSIGIPSGFMIGGLLAAAGLRIVPPSAYFDAAQFNNKEIFNGFQDVLNGKKNWAMHGTSVEYAARSFQTLLSSAPNQNIILEENEIGRDEYAAKLAAQGRFLLEVPSIKNLADKNRTSFVYASTDMIIDRSSGEPELHIVVRYTTKKPTFPRKRKRTEEKQVAPPVLEPGLLPLPVKG